MKLVSVEVGHQRLRHLGLHKTRLTHWPGSRHAADRSTSSPRRLEALYSELMALEVLLLNAAQAAPGVARFEYVETTLERDRVYGFKLMAMRVVVEG